MQSTSGRRAGERRHVGEQRAEHGEQAVRRRALAEDRSGRRRAAGRSAGNASKSWRTTPKPNSRSSTPARASRTSAPASTARSRSTPSRRVLPIPAGPSNASTPPSPARSRASAAAISADLAASRLELRGPGPARGTARGGGAGAGSEQPLVQRDQLRSRHRAELLAQQHAQLVVGASSASAMLPRWIQDRDQRRAGRLADGAEATAARASASAPGSSCPPSLSAAVAATSSA